MELASTSITKGRRYIYDGWMAVAERKFEAADSGTTTLEVGASKLERIYVTGPRIDEWLYAAIDFNSDGDIGDDLNSTECSWSGGVAGKDTADAAFYFLTNRMGSIAALLDKNNDRKILEYYRYRAFGEMISLPVVDDGLAEGSTAADGLEDSPLSLTDNNTFMLSLRTTHGEFAGRVSWWGNEVATFLTRMNSLLGLLSTNFGDYSSISSNKPITHTSYELFASALHAADEAVLIRKYNRPEANDSDYSVTIVNGKPCCQNGETKWEYTGDIARIISWIPKHNESPAVLVFVNNVIATFLNAGNLPAATAASALFIVLGNNEPPDLYKFPGKDFRNFLGAELNIRCCDDTLLQYTSSASSSVGYTPNPEPVGHIRGEGKLSTTKTVTGNCVTLTAEAEFRINRTEALVATLIFGASPPWPRSRIIYKHCCGGNITVKYEGTSIPSHKAYYGNNSVGTSRMENHFLDFLRFLIRGTVREVSIVEIERKAKPRNLCENPHRARRRRRYDAISPTQALDSIRHATAGIPSRMFVGHASFGHASFGSTHGGRHRISRLWPGGVEGQVGGAGKWLRKRPRQVLRRGAVYRAK